MALLCWIGYSGTVGKVADTIGERGKCPLIRSVHLLETFDLEAPILTLGNVRVLKMWNISPSDLFKDTRTLEEQEKDHWNTTI